MMRKLSIVLTAVALMAVLATAAFAQPNISGQVLVRTNVNFPESGDTTYTFLGRALLNFSGSVSDQVSYYARLQTDWAGTSNYTSLPYVYIDVKNLVGENSTLRLGRQGIYWAPHNWFGGLIADDFRAASLTLNAADNVELRAFGELESSDQRFGGEVSFKVGPGTLSVNALSAVASSGEREIGFSADAKLSFAGVNVWGEVGKTPGNDDLDIKLIGVSFDAIKDAIGWNNWLEYDIEAEEFAIRLGKTHGNGLTTNFTLLNDSEEKTITLRTDVSVSF